jgi:hypothetical protein
MQTLLNQAAIRKMFAAIYKRPRHSDIRLLTLAEGKISELPACVARGQRPILQSRALGAGGATRCGTSAKPKNRLWLLSIKNEGENPLRAVICARYSSDLQSAASIDSERPDN